MSGGGPGKRRGALKEWPRRLLRSRLGHRIVHRGARMAIGLVRWLGPRRAGALASAVARAIGPRFREQRLADANLAAAFPGLDRKARRKILAGVWDNLARTVVEYVDLDRLVDFDPFAADGRVTVSGTEHFLRLRDDGRPAIIFTAHLANWEMLAAAAAKFGLTVTALYRPPSNLAIADDLLKRRQELMGGLVASGRGASFEVAAALERGEHLGLMVDQRKETGPIVPFFGRPAPTNPMAAKLARAFDCPVHGARAIRLPGGRFHLEMTPELELPRDAAGAVDVDGATAMIQGVVEGWVREHPEQWLWLHDRWRIPAWRRKRMAAGAAS